MNTLRRCLILSHRYLGIPLSIMFVVWFVSGLVMMYAGGMPALSGSDRLLRAEPVDLEAVRVSARAAATAAGFDTAPSTLHLESVLGRPAYRVGGPFGGATTVFADTGDVLDEVAPAEAAAAAATFLGVSTATLQYARTLVEPDQWTLTQPDDLPLHEFAAADGQGTRIYVSAYGGDVALVTTRAGRTLAWIGVIPHWLYFTPLRLDQPVWYWTVVALSALGCVLAAFGLTLAVTQFRRSRPFSWARSVRYTGWMRWHYFSGALFGLFTLTWVFSGLMSMEPFAWTRATGVVVPHDAISGGALELDRYPALAGTSWPSGVATGSIKAIEYVRILDEPHLIVTTAASPVRSGPRERLHQPYPVTLDSHERRQLVHAETMHLVDGPVAIETLVERVDAALVDVAVREHALLDDYDAYYYSRDRSAPLPVLRLVLDDPLETWQYIDPMYGRIVARTQRYSRIERWLFNGLHSLDFAFWYDKRPLWDIGMILLSLGALTTSVIGLCLGFRRLVRAPARRSAAPL